LHFPVRIFRIACSISSINIGIRSKFWAYQNWVIVNASKIKKISSGHPAAAYFAFLGSLAMLAQQGYTHKK
jgi:hypothetical protein